MLSSAPLRPPHLLHIVTRLRDRDPLHADVLIGPLRARCAQQVHAEQRQVHLAVRLALLGALALRNSANSTPGSGPMKTASTTWMEWLRWPYGIICPNCQHNLWWRIADGSLKRAACRVRTSVTSGTIFERTRTPLTLWFTACWPFGTGKVARPPAERPWRNLVDRRDRGARDTDGYGAPLHPAELRDTVAAAVWSWSLLNQHICSEIESPGQAPNHGKCQGPLPG